MSDAEEDGNANEDLELLGGGDFLTAKMELSTAKTTLNEKLSQNKALLVKVEELKSGLETQKSDAKDIYFYLHKKLDDNYNVIDNLEKVRVELSDELEQKIEYYEEEIKKMKKLQGQEIEALEATVQDQEEELFSLKEYKENKVILESNMKDLSEALAAEKKGRQSDIDLLERKMFHEKERIKKEFLIKIKETKQNLLSMTEDQLHTTTKRTIMENEQMTTELQYQSRETERLLKMNTKLRADNKNLKRNVSLTEEAGREYAKKTYFYQKLIKKLHEKIQDQSNDKNPNEGSSSSNSNNNNNNRRHGNRGRATMDGNNTMVAGRSGRGTNEGSGNGSKRDKDDDKAQQRLVRGLRDKVENLELNLNQVCNELDATRRQLHRVSNQNNNYDDDAMGSSSLSSRQSLLDFLIVSLNDAKAEALLSEAGEGLAPTTEPSVYPPSLRVKMITQVLQMLSMNNTDDTTHSPLREEFNQMFDSGGGPRQQATPLNDAVKETKTFNSIAIQTDNVDPITVLKNVNVGPMSRSANAGFSFFTDEEGGGGLDGGGSSINLSESATSRFLRGPVRGWGAPTSTYGMPKPSGPKTYRKRRTGLGATGKSVMTM